VPIVQDGENGMTNYYIVYSDLSIYDSRATDEPPLRGVQVVVQQHPDVGWHVQCKYDFYMRRDGRWVGVDRAGLFDALEEMGLARFNIGFKHQVLVRGKWRKVDEFGLYKYLETNTLALFGRTETTKKFYAAMAVANSIRQVQLEKTGFLPEEVAHG